MNGTSKTSSPASSSLSTSYLRGAISTSGNINFKLSKLRKHFNSTQGLYHFLREKPTNTGSSRLGEGPLQVPFVS